MKILVAGGGIGGLAAAARLARGNHEVHLRERNEDPVSAVGAGIVMAPNAMAALAGLGISTGGQRLDAMTVASSKGKELSRIRVGEVGGFAAHAFARPELHALLYKAVASSVHRAYGVSVESVRDAGDEVVVAGDESFDLVIGADGLNSTVRRSLYGEVPRRYTGTTCWRGILPNPGLPDHEALEAWGGDVRVGLVPLTGGRIYYYLVKRADRMAPTPGFPGEFVAAFSVIRSPAVARFLDALKAEPPLHHDLEELEEPHWGKGRVILLGDAAHAMTPNQGQGAAMALEDAIALDLALRDGGAAGALDRYVSQRAARVRKMQLDSRRIGEVAHWTNGLAVGLRDAAIRLMPAAAGQRQYRAAVDPGLSLAAMTRG